MGFFCCVAVGSLGYGSGLAARVGRINRLIVLRSLHVFSLELGCALMVCLLLHLISTCSLSSVALAFVHAQLFFYFGMLVGCEAVSQTRLLVTGVGL